VIEEEWRACDDFEVVFDYLESTALPQRKLRLFEVASARRFTSRMSQPVLVNALNVAELFADGLIAQAELASAHQASRELENESAMNEEDLLETDALHYGAKAVREVTAPDAPGYCAGTPAMIEHVISAVTYTFPSARKGNHEEQVAFFEQVSACEKRSIAELVHDVFGNPFRPAAFSKSWGTDTAVSLARQMYGSRDFSAMPILADALQDAGCDNAEILDHCRGPGPHVRGCWVVDLVLGKV
jgi:hypothetical protein